MGLDIRLPLGLIFSIMGVILGAYGIVTRASSLYQICEGINVNLIWGVVMFLFGVAMLSLSRRDRQP